jgi:light-regulated signal transduction histidine kinase (bacteriophytochrome)
VSLTQIANDVMAGLQAADPARKVRWIVEDGVTASGDPGLLRALFDNLLGNAWKFVANKDGAEIEFGRNPDDRSCYFIRDNGAGFDMAYAGKLFVPFQRLHAATEYAGTGIGLATVQRIVRRHGGTIRAEGAVDKGATFYFRLPDPEAT